MLALQLPGGRGAGRPVKRHKKATMSMGCRNSEIAYSNPHHPGPGDDYLEGGVFAVHVAGGFIFVRATECLVLNKKPLGSNLKIENNN